MDKTITATPVNFGAGEINFIIDLPNQCPCCSVAYSQGPLDAYYVKTSFDYNTYASMHCIYFCPHCERFFSVQYFTDVITNRYPHGYIEKIFPTPSHSTSFTDQIKILSPKFVEIFRQSEQAEFNGLTEICGMGYRKALEFLVKDYLLFLKPADSDGILSKQLGTCINDYIDNQRVKTLAKASAWLGNDETHYMRKHEDYNVNHLKTFIHAIVNYIDSELSFLEAEKIITTPK